MLTDVDIAHKANLRPIADIAADLGLTIADYEPRGWYKAKIDLGLTTPDSVRPGGKLVLVTATSPTPAGEGKTTMNVGLSMALNRLGHRAISALREPSLGPVFGRKGGAAGGGYAQVVPMDDINLHFTGDFHAITSAHNLLAAMLDNELYWGNEFDIDPDSVTWPRVLDMNDRALRRLDIEVGKPADGVTRRGGFDITAASEIMAILCLATSLEDLERRLGDIVVATNRAGQAVRARDLRAHGAMTMLLRDALRPNLVQTLENTPAILHGGPFANIAHGNNSILATRAAMGLADYTITEAGFGADLGAEKFFDIVAPAGGFRADATVLVSTIRSLRYNGGADVDAVHVPDAGATRRGLVNLRRHLENLAKFDTTVVVGLNSFPTDTAEEVALVRACAEEAGVRFAAADVFARGGEGGEDLARAVVEACAQASDAPDPSAVRPRYDPAASLRDKVATVAREVYRAEGVDYTPAAQAAMERIEHDGFGGLPVCIAKTQYSFSGDPALIGAPEGFRLPVREVLLNAGAGFVVCVVGTTMRMPGLPRVPAAIGMHVTADGEIVGLS